MWMRAGWTQSRRILGGIGKPARGAERPSAGLQDLAELGRRRHDDLRVQPPGLAGQPLDRPGDRHRSDDAARRPAHRRGHRRDTGLPLSDALRPARAAARADRAVAVKRASRRPRCRRSGSSQAIRMWAAEPAFIVSVLPTGTVSRRPVSRSAAATQTRLSPWRR